MLLAAASALAVAETEVIERRAERDRLVAKLVDDGVRQVDVGDALGLSRKALGDARDRGRVLSAPQEATESL